MVYLARTLRKNRLLWSCWWVILVCTLWKMNKRKLHSPRAKGVIHPHQLRKAVDISETAGNHEMFPHGNIFTPKIVKKRGVLKQQLTPEEMERLTRTEKRKIKEESEKQMRLLKEKAAANRARQHAFQPKKTVKTDINHVDGIVTDKATHENLDKPLPKNLPGIPLASAIDVYKRSGISSVNISPVQFLPEQLQEAIGKQNDITPLSAENKEKSFESGVVIQSRFESRKLLSLEAVKAAIENKAKSESHLSMERQDQQRDTAIRPQSPAGNPIDRLISFKSDAKVNSNRVNEQHNNLRPIPVINRGLVKGVPAKKVTSKPYEMIDPRFSKNLSTRRPLMKFLIQPPIPDSPACGSEMQCFKTIGIKLTFVSIVQIAPKEVVRRQLIRETMNSIEYVDGIRFMNFFIMGKSARDTDNQRIPEEAAQYKDIILYDGLDAYSTLNVKSATSLQWASEHLPQDYIVAKLDADVTRDFTKIVRFYTEKINQFGTSYQKVEQETDSVEEVAGVKDKVSEAIKSMPIVCCISIFADKRPILDHRSKWFVSKTMYALNRWPVMCAGQFYIMPVSLASEIAAMSRDTAMIYLEDVWITGLLRHKLGKGVSNIQTSQSPLFGKHLESRSESNIRSLISKSHDAQMSNLRNRCLCTNKNARASPQTHQQQTPAMNALKSYISKPKSFSHT